MTRRHRGYAADLRHDRRRGQRIAGETTPPGDGGGSWPDGARQARPAHEPPPAGVPPPPPGWRGSDQRSARWHRRQQRREARRARRHAGGRHGRSGLYRDRQRGRIVGVCAGLADHLGWETWVVRCAAVTGLIFMPQIVFVAYWVLYFVMDDRRPEAGEGAAARTDAAAGANEAARPASRAPIAGLERGAGLAQRLRRLRSGYESAEARVRRLEGYVTSPRFELERQLRDVEGA
jgi:phage shock protein C